MIILKMNKSATKHKIGVEITIYHGVASFLKAECVGL
jgi:hypothetical protein